MSIFIIGHLFENHFAPEGLCKFPDSPFPRAHDHRARRPRDQRGASGAILRIDVQASNEQLGAFRCTPGRGDNATLRFFFFFFFFFFVFFFFFFFFFFLPSFRHAPPCAHMWISVPVTMCLLFAVSRLLCRLWRRSPRCCVGLFGERIIVGDRWEWKNDRLEPALMLRSASAGAGRRTVT